MNGSLPSVARRASVIATAVLATAIAAMTVLVLYIFWLGYTDDAGETFREILMRDLREVPAFVVSLCVSTAVASPLLLRVARITRLLHSALLSAAAVGATWGVYRSERVDFLEDFANDTMLVDLGVPITLLVTFPLLQIVHIAMGSFLYHAGRRYFRPTPPSESPSPLAPTPGSGSRFGTRAEIRTFWLLIATIVLIAGGIALAARELLLRQIPPTVWEAFEHADEVTLFSLKPMMMIPGFPMPEGFHHRPIAGQVAVSAARDRAAIAACLKRCLAGSGEYGGGAFSPEFGIRVKDGAATFDLLIWPSTHRIVIYGGASSSSEIEIQGSPTEIEALLRDAGVDIPVQGE